MSSPGITNPSPQIPANTPVGASGSIQILPGGPGALPKTTDNYLALASGTVVVNGVTPATVVDVGVTANSVVVFTVKTVGGTVSASPPNVLTITPGTSFTVGALASDTSTYNWLRLG